MEIKTLTSSLQGANSYLLIDSATKKAALVDPGDNGESLVEQSHALGVTVEAILLTHGHFDHILALDTVKRLTGAKVYIHKLDNVCLSNPMFSLMNHVGRDDTFDDADVLVDDGDIITIGNSKIEVVYTPGHTVGSVCYLTDAGIISGDTLFCESIGRTDFPGGDFDSIELSIRRLYRLRGDKKVYPGHGCATTLSHERKWNMFVKEK